MSTNFKLKKKISQLLSKRPREKKKAPKINNCTFEKTEDCKSDHLSSLEH